MSNYTIVTNFASKDALVSGNALKALKGAEFTTEFTAVQTAVNSKPDGAVQFFPDGTVAQPSIGFTNNNGTGMYNAAGVLNFATGATQRLSIATTGAVTINASSSGTTFSVNSIDNVQGMAFNVNSPTLGAYFGFLSATVLKAAVGLGSVVGIGGGLNDFSIVSTGGKVILGGAAAALTVANAGNVTIAAPSSGVALTINGAAAQIAVFSGSGGNTYCDITRSSVLTGRFGSSDSITLGGVSTDFALSCLTGGLVFATSGTSNIRFTISSAGGMFTGGATGGDQGAGTINAGGLYVNGVSAFSSGSFTGTLTGFVGNPTPTCTYIKCGNVVTLTIPVSTGVSNATTMTLTGLPAAIQPANTNVWQKTLVTNNGSTANDAYAAIGTGWAVAGTMVFGLQTTVNSYNTSGFTASGTKGFSNEISIVYNIA